MEEAQYQVAHHHPAKSLIIQVPLFTPTHHYKDLPQQWIINWRMDIYLRFVSRRSEIVGSSQKKREDGAS